jgi:Alpha/beta hydrolase family
MNPRPNIVLVHGAWADGSSWSAVIERLHADGYDKVTAPQFPESSLAADVARLREVLARQDGPTLVAGHSYGGQIITERFSSFYLAGLKYVDGFGELPGLPGAAAEFAQDAPGLELGVGALAGAA